MENAQVLREGDGWEWRNPEGRASEDKAEG